MPYTQIERWSCARECDWLDYTVTAGDESTSRRRNEGGVCEADGERGQQGGGEQEGVESRGVRDEGGEDEGAVDSAGRGGR